MSLQGREDSFYVSESGHPWLLYEWPKIDVMLSHDRQRNPIVNTKALLVPLENPQKVINGQQARLGPPVLLDLGNRGVRSIERIGDTYFIVAGPPADEGSFALYKWSGKSDDAPKRIERVRLDGLSPEALFAIPDSDQVQILSDDGGVDVNGAACKVSDETDKSFRSIIIEKP